MCVHMDGSQRSLPRGVRKISDNGISIVYRGGGFIYKRSIPFLIENEYFMLRHLYSSGLVPRVERYDKYTLKIEDLGKSEPVTNEALFRLNMGRVVDILEHYTVRHGDLTSAAIIVRNNRPYLVDFAESRFASDVRPDKRIEGDRYWIAKTTEELCQN